MIGLDHEYIAENASLGTTPPASRPDPRTTYCEVMQMGGCKLDSDGAEVGVLNRIVRGHQLMVVPAWLESMTGLTTERREDEGVSFPEAFDELIAFIGNDRPWVFNLDWYVLKANAEAHGIAFPYQEAFRRVKQELTRYGVGLKEYQAKGFDEVNSGHLYAVLGLELPFIEGVGAHDAAHDARSIAHSMQYLRYWE